MAKKMADDHKDVVMSNSDREALAQAGRDYNNAKTDEERAAAHDRAQAIRHKNNYDGGADGSSYSKWPSGGNTSPENKPSNGNRGESLNKQVQNYSNGGNTSNPANNGGSSSSPNRDPNRDYSALDIAKEHGVSQSDIDRLAQNGDAYANLETQAQALESSGKKDSPEYQSIKKQQGDLAQNSEEIRHKYNYSGGDWGNEYHPWEEPKPQKPVSPGAPDLSGFFKDWFDTAKNQAQLQTDYAVNQGIKELERAKADADPKFDAQLEQNAIEERKALDNHALYMEARGDRGGIGHAQYGQIQAQALQNRQAINTARNKLATDTARQIADLRARGEFEKADKILSLTQEYLKQMVEFQKWGAEFNWDIQKFNSQLNQWQQEYDFKVGQLIGNINGTPTLDAQKLKLDQLMDGFNLALSMGVRPTDEQIAAMGYTPAQVESLLAEQRKQLANKGSSGGGRGSGGSGGYGGSSGSSLSKSELSNIQKTAFGYLNNEYDEEKALNYLINNMQSGLSATDARKIFIAIGGNPSLFDSVFGQVNAEPVPADPTIKDGWNGNVTSFNFDQDAGIIKWAGVTYANSGEFAADLAAAIDGGIMTKAAREKLMNKIKNAGISIELVYD